MSFSESSITDESSIIRQVERICNSPEFKSKPSLSKFLSYVVSEYLAGRGEKLKGYTIGVEVFNQGEDFDPDQNALVRIHAGRLRRLLKTYYLEEGKSDQLIIDIPKGNYVPVIRKREEETISFSATSDSTDPGSSTKKSSISVIPFIDNSKDNELAYLAFSFSHELSIALTKFDDLRVVGCTIQPETNILDKSFTEHFRNQDIRFLVNGDITRLGNQVKLSIHLTDASDFSILWGNNYKFNPEADDLFDLQEDIVLDISNRLGAEYGIVNQKRYLDIVSSKTDSVNEHIVLLKWYYYISKLTPESHKDMYETLSRAITEEPDSGLLNSILAHLYGQSYALDSPDSDGSYERLGELAEKAFELNPGSQFVKVILAFKCFMFSERERFFHLAEEGLKWAPNSPLRLGTFAMYTCLYGEWEMGKEFLDRIFANNVELPRWLYGVTCLYYFRKFEYESALKEANKYHVPMLFWGPMLRTAVLGQLEKKQEAEKHIEDLLGMRPDFCAKSRNLLSRYIKEDILVEHVLEGLRKAGMNL